MGRKKDNASTESKSRPAPLAVDLKPQETKEQAMAKVGVRGMVGNAFITLQYLQGSGLGNGDSLKETSLALKEVIDECREGKIKHSERMLISQSVALNAMFGEMARRAAVNMGEHPDAFDSYMRLALKAQAQCRATLEALAEIQNPRQVAFVRQANIAHGHQQVNNGAEPRAGGETSTGPNKELEVIDGQWVDGGAQAEAIGGDPPLEAVVEVHRTKDEGRKRTRGR